MVTRKRRAEPLQFPASHGFRLLFLCGFFILGAAVGHILTRVFGSDLTLKEIVLDLAMQDASTVNPSPWKIVVIYLRFPLLAYILGYCSFAIIAVSALVMVLGFSLSFAASALVASLGADAIPLVLTSFGLRGLITIVCTVILSLWSFNRALGNSDEIKHQASQAIICLFLLLFGITLELTLMPTLFSSALHGLELH